MWLPEKVLMYKNGATTFGITTLSIMGLFATFGITTLSIMGLFATFSINDIQHK